MLKLFKYLKLNEWLMIIVSIGFIILHVWLDLLLPDFMSKMTTLVQTEGSSITKILEQGGYMLACAFGSICASIIVGFFAARIASLFALRLRQLIFLKVESFSLSEIKQFSTASLVTRSTNDVMQIQNTISMGLQVIIKAPILATWAIVKIVNKSWQWSMATAVAVVVMLLVIGFLMFLVVPKFQKIQNLTDSLNRITRENLIGLRVVRAYNAEKFSEQKFDVANEKMYKNNLFIFRAMSIMGPMMTLIMSGLSLSIYWIGAALIQSADIIDKLPLFSDMVVFMSYSVQVVMAFMMLTIIFMLVPRATVSARRINEVLMKPCSIKYGDFDGNTQTKGSIQFKNVSFKYPDAKEYVLKDISFSAKKGEMIAFIGSTGSGKSTLINLVPRFYDVTDGEILIDGINIKEYKKEALSKKIGYVPQKAVLFSGTIQSNVNFGDNDLNTNELNGVLDIAQASEFVNKMENKLNSQIVQAGKNISGGQKQRVAIARALARKPEFLIFDDSFSALDYKTDKNLRSRLQAMENKPTTLVVAQRIGTIKDADKIIVLEDGKLVGQGTHQQLMKNCKVYKEIALSQFSKEELE